jgi:4'-phosphopantetheinyl transferase EntD
MLAKITFVVKEAFYKCQYGITEEMLDFLEVEMAIHLGDCTWRVERVRRREPLWRGFEGIGGRFIVEQELIAAGVGIPAATDGVSL